MPVTLEEAVNYHLTQPFLGKTVGDRMCHNAWIYVLNGVSGGPKGPFRVRREHYHRFDIGLDYNYKKGYGTYKIFDAMPLDGSPRKPLHGKWKAQLLKEGEGVKLPPYHSWTYYNPKNKKYNPEVFNCRHNSNELVGIRVGMYNLRIKLILTRDIGTHNRTYAHSTQEQANEYIKKNINNLLMHSFQHLEAKFNDNNMRGISEVLAGAFWRCDGSSMVIVYNKDSLQSKLLAQLRALDIEDVLKSNPLYYKNKYHAWYQGYKVPLILWGDGGKNCQIYTKLEQEIDLSTIFEEGLSKLQEYKQLIIYKKYNYLSTQLYQSSRLFANMNMPALVSFNYLGLYGKTIGVPGINCELCRYVLNKMQSNIIRINNDTDAIKQFFEYLSTSKSKGLFDYYLEFDNQITSNLGNILQEVSRNYKLSQEIIGPLIYTLMYYQKLSSSKYSLLDQVLSKLNRQKTATIARLIYNFLLRYDISNQQVRILDDIIYRVELFNDFNISDPSYLNSIDTLLRMMLLVYDAKRTSSKLNVAKTYMIFDQYLNTFVHKYINLFSDISLLESSISYKYDDDNPKQNTLDFIKKVIEYCVNRTDSNKDKFISNDKALNQVKNATDPIVILNNINSFFKSIDISKNKFLHAGLYYICRTLGLDIKFSNNKLNASIILSDHGVARTIFRSYANDERSDGYDGYSRQYQNQSFTFLYRQQRSRQQNHDHNADAANPSPIEEKLYRGLLPIAP